MTGDAHRLRPLFEPRGVLVAGVSAHPGKYGFVALHHLLAGGYRGAVFALGREAEILGHKTLSDISDLPDGVVDLAFLCVPPPAVPELVRACAAKGVRAVFVASSGYAESGDTGARAETELVDLATELGVVLIGPNGMGVVSTPAALHLLIAGPRAPSGSISVVSQSGNVVMAVANSARHSGIGLSRAVSVGNSAALGVADYLDFLAGDDSTSVVLAYIEGIDDGRRLYDALRATAAVKPVVLMKGGISPAGQRAASSHTGALATDDRVFDGMCRQAGVTRVHSVEEGFDAAATFATQPPPGGPRLAVLTTAGGWGVMAADAVAATSLHLAPLPDDVRAAIDELVPPRWSRANPVDLAGGEQRDTIPVVLDLLAGSPDIDAVILAGIGIQANTAQGLREGPFHPDHGIDRIVGYHRRQDARFAEAAAEASTRHRKPVLTVTELGVTDPANPAPAAVRASGRYCYPTIQRAVAGLDRLLLDTKLRAGRPDSRPA